MRPTKCTPDYYIVMCSSDEPQLVFEGTFLILFIQPLYIAGYYWWGVVKIPMTIQRHVILALEVS